MSTLLLVVVLAGVLYPLAQAGLGLSIWHAGAQPAQGKPNLSDPRSHASSVLRHL